MIWTFFEIFGVHTSCTISASEFLSWNTLNSADSNVVALKYRSLSGNNIQTRGWIRYPWILQISTIRIKVRSAVKLTSYPYKFCPRRLSVHPTSYTMCTSVKGWVHKDSLISQMFVFFCPPSVAQTTPNTLFYLQIEMYPINYPSKNMRLEKRNYKIVSLTFKDKCGL